MKIIDLFCGIGGLSLGFEQAGFEVVSAIDMWSDAIKTYNHNRTDKVAKVETVEQFNEEDLPKLVKEHHITGIIGGPPCQGFSTVGKREIDDPRNQMYLEFYKAVKTAMPDFSLSLYAFAISSAPVPWKHPTDHILFDRV